MLNIKMSQSAAFYSNIRINQEKPKPQKRIAALRAAILFWGFATFRVIIPIWRSPVGQSVPYW